MGYRDYFRHIERRVKQKQEEKKRERKIRRAAEKLAERLDTSSVQALSKLQESPEIILEHWRREVNEAPEKRERSVQKVMGRLKDEANAPSVGDEVKVEFERENMTFQQKEIDGSKGTVKIRDPFSMGSQRATYTVEIHESETESGMPVTINNLTPGEVVPVNETNER